MNEDRQEKISMPRFFIGEIYQKIPREQSNIPISISKKNKFLPLIHVNATHGN